MIGSKQASNNEFDMTLKNTDISHPQTQTVWWWNFTINNVKYASSQNLDCQTMRI